MDFREETPPTNCPLCGRTMILVNDLKGFSVQLCRVHGIFGVDKPTNDVWVFEGFEISMAPVKRKWYLVENHRPLTIDQYREMVKNANYRRLEALDEKARARSEEEA